MWNCGDLVSVKTDQLHFQSNCIECEGKVSNGGRDGELAADREHVAHLYRRVAAEREALTSRLDATVRESTPGAEWQRDMASDALRQRLSALRIADNGLCFGRLDDRDGNRTYIGRMGVFDESEEYEPLLLDWRAPAARPFYCATAKHPDGIVRRRHLRTSGRAVVDFHDDFLDEGHAPADSALLAAVDAPRGTTMRDIVSTIQAEQDEIIRLDHPGVLVIDGGPGTGKTVVALHRVAYLLYHRRETLSRRGVLIVGPNRGFLRYISNVLPSLGETDVVSATPGELFPGVATAAEEEPELQRLKGRSSMVDVLAAAVADRQEIPHHPIPIELDDVTVLIDETTATTAREKARATGFAHNKARPVFRRALIECLTDAAVNKIGEGWLTTADTAIRNDLAADVRHELERSPDLRDALDELWPRLTPQRLLADLFGSRERLAAVGLGEEWFRVRGDAWTVSDVPLLDEAVEFLGQEERPQQRQDVDYALGVLQILDTDEDDETLRAVDVIDARQLAERNVERDHRSVAERAAADRDWTYGHVVLDEAQELSEMDWRLIMRRCPSKSVTIVGDLAQRRSEAGARSWADMLDDHVPRRWLHRRLAINYRTPAGIMAVAAEVLAGLDPALEPPESVRANGILPWSKQVAPEELGEAVADAVRDGTVVIAPAELNLPEAMTPKASKGLEFDSVIVVEPQKILSGRQGLAELYVALTRATQRLGVLHTEPLTGAWSRKLEPYEVGRPER
ncbi:AAA family ATPase [Saccharopolyspora erythraea]|nr:AAA family ATPase [Saccharopolyspora erythraea]